MTAKVIFTGVRNTLYPPTYAVEPVREGPHDLYKHSVVGFSNLFRYIFRDINKNVYDQLQSLKKCKNSTLLQVCCLKHNKNNVSSVVNQPRETDGAERKQYIFTEICCPLVSTADFCKCLQASGTAF